MKRFKYFTFTTSLLCLASLSILFLNCKPIHGAGKTEIETADKGFAVVELFTSEGCSSCPPADALVAALQQENQDKQIYVLAYHVDYWDHQGWKDAYSNADYSKRQTRYAGWLNSESIYTPQIVVNGKSGFVGSDRGALVSAVAAGLHYTPANSLTLKNSVADNQITIEYQTNELLKETDLVVSLIQKNGQSKVRAGENSGLTLTHVQIVTKQVVETLHHTSGSLKLNLPQDFERNKWELIGFLQNQNNGVILSATRSTLQ